MILKYGMIGGGPGSFMGAVHRRVAALDGVFELVCGSFSSSPEKSRETGTALSLDPERIYESFDEMMERERTLPDEERMRAVSIITPNHLHFEPAIKALEKGFHVIIDKPLAFSLQQAVDLKTAVDKSGCVFAVTYTYTGYPMLKEAQHLMQSGKLGRLQKVYVEYPQGWLSEPLEKKGVKQAVWRTDPERSGAGGAIGDIGTHAFNLAEYITGRKVTHICAELNTIVDGRQLDDDAMALLKMDNGASGVLLATQVATGEENDLKIRVYGDKGGLEWSHNDPATLWLKHPDQPVQKLRAGNACLSEAAARNTRVPPGHPEGYFEAFANIYTAFGRAVEDHAMGKYTSPADYDFPSVEDGLRGMAFVETMVASNKSSQKWTKLKI